MSDDKLRDSLEKLFSGFSPPEPEGKPEPPPPPTPEEGRPQPAPPPTVEEVPVRKVEAGPVAPPEVPEAPPRGVVILQPIREAEEEEKEEEVSRPIIAARVTTVRDRLIGTLSILLTMLAASALFIFSSFRQAEEANVALQQLQFQENAALKVEGATINLLALMVERGQERDAARFRQDVEGSWEALQEATDELISAASALPQGDPLRQALIRLYDYTRPVENLTRQMLRYAEAGNWRVVRRYTQLGLVSFYHQRLSSSMARVRELTAEREADQLARLSEARQLVRRVPVVWGLLITATMVITTVATLRSIAWPLEQITHATSRLAAGHLGERVRVEQADEFGKLAVAFNRMASSLQALYSELEERVQERTRALQEANYALQRRAMQLEASAEVGRAITSIFDVDQLLRRTVDLIRERFGFYHAGIFLMDESGRWAVLREATGEAGAMMKARGHRLPVGETSMVGWTALHRRPRIALDVGADAVHFANPLLPYTRSEMTLPLMVGTRLLGVLDVQSTEEAAFDEDDVRALQSMADQIAVALENAWRISDEALLLEATSPIYRASRRLATAMAVEEVVNVIVDLVKETDVDGCIVALTEPYGSREPEVFHFVASWRRDQESPIRPGTRLPVSAAHMRMERIRNMLVVTDISAPGALPEEERDFFRRAGVEAVANIPLRIGDRLLGFVAAYRVTPGGFPESAVRLYEVLSDQASVAMDRVRLLELARRRAEQEAAVRVIGDRIARAVDLEGVLRGSTEELARMLRATGVYVELGPGGDRVRGG